MKVICFAQNPPAAMRGGFLHWGACAGIGLSGRIAGKGRSTATPPYLSPESLPVRSSMKCGSPQAGHITIVSRCDSLSAGGSCSNRH
jgi:hypothetical protein